MKIQKIEVYNFRNYYGYHSFNLDKNITIFYGENGYGKSTFFDAIEWCITNEIERFKNQDGEIDFNNADCVNNKARQELEPECYVAIYYENYRLLRKYSASTVYTSVSLSRIDNQPEVLIAHGQKNVENELYKYKENIRSSGAKMIKHSYVLSQDQISNFIRSNPKERFDSLASIMGINKFTSFIDNLKTSNSFIQSTYKGIENEFENNQKLIANHINDREDSIQIKNKIEELTESLKSIGNLDTQSNLGLEKINIYAGKLNNKLVINRQTVNFLKEIPTKYSNYKELSIDHERLENEYNIKVNLLARANDSKALAEKEIDGITSAFKRISEEQNLLETIESEKNKISKIHHEISEMKLDKLTNEEVQNKLARLRKQLEVIDFTLLYIKDYQRGEKDCNEIPNIIKTLEGEIVTLEGRIKSRKKLLVSVEQWLIENNASSSLQGLIQYLQGISNYVKGNEVQRTCPVCSSYVGDSLEMEIDDNIARNTSKLSEVELSVVKAYDLQSRKEKEVALFGQKLHTHKQEIAKLEQVLEGSSDILRSISRNIQFDNNLFNSNKSDIQENKMKLTEELRDTEVYLEKNSKVVTMESKLRILLEGLNLKRSEGSLKNKLEFNKGAFLRKIRRIDKLIERNNKEIEEIRRKRDVVSAYISGINKLDDVVYTDQEFTEIINRMDEETKVLASDSHSIEKIKEFIIKNNEKKESIERLVSYEVKEVELRGEMKKWNEKFMELDEYIKNLTTEVGVHALEFLNHPHSKIQQYYRYLNPMPTTNGNIHFVSDNSDETKRGLSITVPYEKDNGEQGFMNARYTLSSAQLNTLAIAIFLVANDSQDVGIFDFVAIDDPIQNMDDVNQYTMCDILGDINKQLLFSTHDLEFLKLFIKKNEYKKQDIRVYFLEDPSLIEGRVKEVTF